MGRRDVRLRLRGRLIERFIRQAILEGLVLSRIRRRSEDEIWFETSRRDAKAVLALARRHKQDVSVLSHVGVWRLIERLRARPMLPVGLVVGLLLWAAALGRVWLIELPEGAPESIALALREMGVRPGVAKASLDTRRMEDRLYLAAPDYAFIGARLTGVRLKLELAQALPEPELYDLSASRDLVAKTDALVVSVDALAGESCVKPGDVVRAGDLLIRGVEKVSDEASRSICALGSVMGRGWVYGEARGTLDEEVFVETGARSVRRELNLFFFTLALPGSEPFPTDFTHERTEREVLPIGGLFVPVSIVKYTHVALRPAMKKRDEAALRAELYALALAEANAKRPGGAQVIDKWADYSMIIEEDERQTLRVRVVMEILEQIAAAKNQEAVRQIGHERHNAPQ